MLGHNAFDLVYTGVGAHLTMFVEHDSVPWEAPPGQMTESDGEGCLAGHGDRVLLSYILQAVKPRVTARRRP